VGAHGKKGSWQVIRRMMQGKPVIIHGDGTSLWALTFNTDFAIGFTGLMGNRHAIGEAFQITGDECLTWNQIYQTVADILDRPLKAYHVSADFLAETGKKYGYDYAGELLGDKSVSVVFDNRKLKRAVPDMKTAVPFHVGACKSLNYMLSHPECQKEDPDFDAYCDRVIAALEKAKAEV
jgi:nucleoside-diphosphate-sugar epimerase